MIYNKKNTLNSSVQDCSGLFRTVQDLITVNIFIYYGLFTTLCPQKVPFSME
ncbi:hypothetical protein NVIRENTERO_01902 [Sodalis praecaptivus]|nr:hypothetical protein NVIRENTERO_01902 [Sodalis praecaptivus]